MSADGLRPPTGCPEYLRGCSTPPSTCRCGTACRRRRATARRSAVLILFGEGPRGPGRAAHREVARTCAATPASRPSPAAASTPADDYPVGTALREAQEEAGIDPDGVRVLATLQELYLPPSDRLVVPVVGWWDDPRDVTVGDPREVARVARVPLADLTDPANRFRVRHPSGFVGPAFAVADMLVWGFTAGLLDAILEAAGLAGRGTSRDVRPLPPSGRTAVHACPGRAGRRRRQDDAAAPTVADPAPDGPPTRTVPPAMSEPSVAGRARRPPWSLAAVVAARSAAAADGDGPARAAAPPRPPGVGTVTTAADGVQEITLQTQDDYVFMPDTLHRRAGHGPAHRAQRRRGDDAQPRVRRGRGPGPIDAGIDFLAPGRR